MSKAASSPTARLLQSSRLFSLPRALPQPTVDSTTSTGIYRSSETATLPYPTHQAITTPASSLSRGDWGLKRPLPSRATRGTSTPHIRVIAQDTPEHITDFNSAADHTQTRAKWLEMGVPLLVKRSRRRVLNHKSFRSVFEEDSDYTDIATASGLSHSTRRDGYGSGAAVQSQELDGQRERWKYAGPWIAGMAEGDFENYTARVGRSRKHHWEEFIREQVVEQRLTEARNRARNEGEPLTAEQQTELRTSLRPSDEELRDYQKRLRDDFSETRTGGLSSELTTLIRKFLDLPAVMSSEDTEFSDFTEAAKLGDDLTETLNEYRDRDSGPPSTHPSAGLSHLRTAMIMPNHPVHGPQAQRPPILARVLRPRVNAQATTAAEAQLGVGGIVAAGPSQKVKHQASLPVAKMDDNPRAWKPEEMEKEISIEVEGGNATYVHPQHAHIDERGRIVLNVTRAEREALAVALDDVEWVHNAKRGPPSPQSVVMPGQQRSVRASLLAPPGTPGNANFGAGLPDLRPGRGREAWEEEQERRRRRDAERKGVQGFESERTMGLFREVLGTDGDLSGMREEGGDARRSAGVGDEGRRR